MNILDFYTLRYNQDGVLITIIETTSGASLIFYPVDVYDENNNLIYAAKTFDEQHYLTLELREREVLYGQLDLSNKEIDTHPGKKKK